MENMQLLNTNQINSILQIVERDYINPSIDRTIKEIKNTKEWKDTETSIKAKTDKINKEIEKLNETLTLKSCYEVDLISDNKIESLITTILNYNFYRWNIIREIKNDITAVLQLTQIGTIDDIIESILPLIDVNKYITKNNDTSVDFSDEDDE
jgi:hypothetical protein